MKKITLVLCLLMVFAVAVVSAASASFNVTSPSKVAGIELKKGEYTVKIKGEEVMLQRNSDKPFAVPAKVETLEKKFDKDTRIEAENKDGMRVINSITFGHSKTRVVFGK